MSTVPQESISERQHRDSAIADYVVELRKRTGGDVRTDAYNRMLYSTDASIYKIKPHAVFFPRNDEDLQCAVELAGKYNVPILPRTGGSSLAGQAVNEAVILDMSRHMDQILEVNREEQWARVQPGVVLDTLNTQLLESGLQFGPDPASSNRACMGGIVANNSTGSHSIMYGMTADHVISTNVFLSDGTNASFQAVENGDFTRRCAGTDFESRIYKQIRELTGDRGNRRIIQNGTPKHWRRAGGYNLDRFLSGEGISFNTPQDPRFNLANLICGSEGTLAVMNEITVGLVPRPKMTGLAVVQFDTLYEALSAVPAMLEVNPSAIELFDRTGIELCRAVPSFAQMLSTFIEGDPNCFLITEFYGESQSELKSKIDDLRRHIKQNQIDATAVVESLDPQRQSNVWAVRKNGLGLMMSIKGDHKPIPFIEDASVPVEHLADYVTKIEDFCASIGTRVAYYAHASAGTLHIRPLINAKTASEVDKIEKIGAFSLELLTGFGGSLCSEHGAGRSRSWLNERLFGSELYGLQKDVKNIFDPKNICNPGILVDPQDIKENLRFGPEYKVPESRDRIDFSSDQGFHRAVEMCNGAAVCRKLGTGAMCPSFMATREEEHSTRGRANALRAALSGDLPFEELTSKRMYEVMDLCIECKACKSECPSSVDMAKLKFEFLARYQERHGVSLRTRLFADIAVLSRLAAGPLAPFINWKMRLPLVKLVVGKLFGITDKRSMPEFARVPFTKWFKSREKQSVQAKHGKVVLFNDTFNTYNYPQTAIATTELLEAAGFEVLLPGIKCCGRPMISKGLVDKARAAAKDTVRRLAPFAKQGIPIVGMEPSCILSLRDEYLYLLPNDEDAKIVAAHCFLIDEFIDSLEQKGKLDLEFTEESKDILLHGHCHQKAIVGTEKTKKMLSLPKNYKVTEVDSSCCGMAGSFGYEAEHYDISMTMAERRLLPTVRECNKETIVTAVGVSCRQQIKHGSSRVAKHIVEVLREAIKN